MNELIRSREGHNKTVIIMIIILMYINIHVVRYYNVERMSKGNRDIDNHILYL